MHRLKEMIRRRLLMIENDLKDIELCYNYPKPLKGLKKNADEKKVFLRN